MLSLSFPNTTTSYVPWLLLDTFTVFLNTTQNGAAHSASGTDLVLLMQNIAASLCLCVVQLTLFCFLRPRCKAVYQPRCHYVPMTTKMEPLNWGFLAWLRPTVVCPVHFYLLMGLDAYFFIRYLSVLLVFFVAVGGVCLVVLMPINWSGGCDAFTAGGLDSLSILNICQEKVRRLKAHFVVTLVVVAAFHVLLVYELRSFVAIRQAYLLSKRLRNSLIHRTVLIQNVPRYVLDREVLTNVLSVIPGGVRNIWYVYDNRALEFETRQANDALDALELAETAYLAKHIRHMKRSSPKMLPRHPHFYPPIYWSGSVRGHHFFLKLPGFCRWPLGRPTHKRDWLLGRLNLLRYSIQDHVHNTNRLDKVFVEFCSLASAYMAHQSLLSQVQGTMNNTLVEVHPADILWANLRLLLSVVGQFCRYAVHLLCVVMIVLYVVPVSFIGIFSQPTLLTQIIPSSRWLNHLPDKVRSLLCSFVPAVLLTLLSDSVLWAFRFLGSLNGRITGSQLELDLQKWYFAFLFVQQFLVVTILTSVVAVFRQVLEQPTLIPILLAANLPKTATFFFQFITLKAFSFCGSNFLQISRLALGLTIYRLVDDTPRKIFRRLTSLPRVRWGSVYPVFTVYACIGLAYCVILPLISVFVMLIIFLGLLYYKYALKYIYSYVNVSESYGRFYPVALFNLYTGIYCLEMCMVGIFFSLRNPQGECTTKVEGVLMSIIMVLTLFGNINIYNKYVKHFSNLPILADKQYKDGTRHDAPNVPPEPDCLLSYSHPDTKVQLPVVWLPRDPHDEALLELSSILKCPGIGGGSVSGASIKVGWTTCIEVFHEPPTLEQQDKLA